MTHSFLIHVHTLSHSSLDVESNHDTFHQDPVIQQLVAELYELDWQYETAVETGNTVLGATYFYINTTTVNIRLLLLAHSLKYIIYLLIIHIHTAFPTHTTSHIYCLSHTYFFSFFLSIPGSQGGFGLCVGVSKSNWLVGRPLSNESRLVSR